MHLFQAACGDVVFQPLIGMNSGLPLSGQNGPLLRRQRLHVKGRIGLDGGPVNTSDHVRLASAP